MGKRQKKGEDPYLDCTRTGNEREERLFCQKDIGPSLSNYKTVFLRKRQKKKGMSTERDRGGGKILEQEREDEFHPTRTKPHSQIPST